MALSRRSFLLAGCLSLCAGRFCAAAGFEPAFPPGVAVQEPSDRNPLPTGYKAQFLAVDWTDPFLKSELMDRSAASGGLPADLQRLEETDRAPALRIQLGQPVQSPAGTWSPALTFAPSRPGLILAPAGGWIPAAEAPSPSAGSGSPVRWLGRGEELDAMPALEFEGRALFEIIHSAAGKSRFLLIGRTAPGRGRLADLKPWLRAEAAPGDWIALHDSGPDLFAAQPGWRLLAPGDPSRPERTGRILVLRTIRPGEPVDWARMPRAGAAASTFEPFFPAIRVIEGHIWPDPLDPRAWIDRPELEKGDSPWIDISLGAVRPVDRIEIDWASSAGWSKEFNPGRCLLQGAEDSGSEPRTLLEIKAPAGPTVWKAAKPLALRRVRLAFPEPATMPIDGRARVAAIRVIGPWDGSGEIR